MKSGLLWLADKKTDSLETNVLAAAKRFEQKYGEAPNLCFVHPSTLPSADIESTHDGVIQIGGVIVRPLRSILPFHYWIGIDQRENNI